MMNSTPGGGHLAYYKEHGISPVTYDVSDLQAHLDRRDSLYRGLGLPGVAFKGCDVLEVAPGSGQNGLYVAASLPARYDMVEPNPTAVRDIERLFANFERSHTVPRLHPVQLEEFDPNARYDIVICENWVGDLPHELLLIRKLADLVRPGGVLAMTLTPTIGLLPNMMRKLLALRLVKREMPFADKVTQLTEAFGPHLRTIRHMTRSHRDWVMDCLLNPHYFNIILPLDAVIAEIGSRAEVLAIVPRFYTDLRWFKSLVASERRFNAAFQASYVSNLHNFVDYRREFAARSAEQNQVLDAICRDFRSAGLAWLEAYDATGVSDPAAAGLVGEAIRRLGAELRAIDAELGVAFDELCAAWDNPDLNAASVASMKHFSGLFGRETAYVSLVVGGAAG
jgi:2-polyprenyl-3-methyl-5-hydroxy-6-metoxy-1,4-benzoquinol methylase